MSIFSDLQGLFKRRSNLERLAKISKVWSDAAREAAAEARANNPSMHDHLESRGWHATGEGVDMTGDKNTHAYAPTGDGVKGDVTDDSRIYVSKDGSWSHTGDESTMDDPPGGKGLGSLKHHLDRFESA